MKPVRVADIVRRKPPACVAVATTSRRRPAKSNGAEAIAGNIKNTAKAVLKSPGAKIPFFIGFVVILAEAVFVVKIATEMVPRPPTSQLSDAWIKPDAAANAPRETAMMQNVAASLPPVSASSAASSYAPPEIKPGLLPVVQLPPPKATSTAASNKKTAIQPSKPKPAASPTPTAVTARSLLDATTLSLNERYDGLYKASFMTNAGTHGKITWDLNKTALTGSGSMPSFSVSFSCDPPPNPPPPDAIDQSPTFNVRTSYVCTIGLTPTSGSSRQTQSRQFSFTAGAGQLVVTPLSTMNTVLQDNVSSGGFVFRNDDAEPVTITGLDVDVSYTALNTAGGPLVLRFADPATELSLIDYHLENLAVNPSLPNTHSGTNIHVPLSLTINPASPKMLPVKILGAHRMSISGVDPSVTVTLRQVTTNQSASRIMLSSAKISWSCVIIIGACDPNATSGPCATGQACRQ